MNKTNFAKAVVVSELILVGIAYPIVAGIFLKFATGNDTSAFLLTLITFVLPISAATLSMAYLLVLGTKRRNSVHLQSWFVLQCIFLCWVIVQTSTYMITLGHSIFLITTLASFLIYKPVIMLLVDSFNAEVRKEERSSSSAYDTATAKAVFYAELFRLLKYTANIIFKFVVEDFMTTSIILLFMCIYAGCMVLLLEMLQIGIYERHRGKLKWWIFLSYIGCLYQLVRGGISFHSDFDEFLWINYFLLFLYKAWSVYIITVFRSSLEQDNTIDLPMVLTDDRPGNNSQRQDWLYASVPVAAASYLIGQNQTTLVTPSYL